MSGGAPCRFPQHYHHIEGIHDKKYVIYCCAALLRLELEEKECHARNLTWNDVIL